MSAHRPGWEHTQSTPSTWRRQTSTSTLAIVTRVGGSWSAVVYQYAPAVAAEAERLGFDLGELTPYAFVEETFSRVGEAKRWAETAMP